ncbi:MAG: alpha-amylase family glycosyl hydrolase [Chloroherpetonaceae bacterium]|nr:alpha-amylase family glycosyl hydrolase [Chloroherpetonaceae bacterium]
MRLFFVLFILSVAFIGTILFFLRGYAKLPKALPNELAFPSPDWVKDAVIYEVFVRNFSAEGTFKALEAKLPELRDLGVSVIWLMPIHPIGALRRKGTLGSPYSVKDYFAIDSALGTKEDFKAFVTAAHQQGMKVIMDMVLNHTAWDNDLIKTKPEFYRRNKNGEIVSPNDDWTDVADLNFSNPELRQYLMSVMRYWITEYDVDGFRCDVAELIPTEFWAESIKELRRIKPSLLMLSEGTLPEHHTAGFDLTYSWTIYDAMTDILKGKKTAEWLGELLEREEKVFPKNSLRMRFNTNHDKNAYDGAPQEHFGSKAAAKLTAAIVFTIGGYGSIRSVPMLYNGDEVGNTKRISLFEKAPVDWNTPDAAEWRAFYKTLIALRKTEPALTSGTMTKLRTSNDEAVFAFERKHQTSRLVVVANFGKSAFNGFVKMEPNQTLIDVFDAERTLQTKDGNLRLTLEPVSFRIWKVKG